MKSRLSTEQRSPCFLLSEMLGRNRKVFLGIFSLTLADVYTIIGAVLVVAVLGVLCIDHARRSFRAMAQIQQLPECSAFP